MARTTISIAPLAQQALLVAASAHLLAASEALPRISVSGTNFECGRQVGSQMKAQINEALTGKSFQAELAWIATSAGSVRYRRALEAHNSTYPHLVREMEGLAAGSGLPFQHIFVKNIDWALIYLMNPWDRDPAASRSVVGAPSLHCTDYIVDHADGGLRGWGHNEDGGAEQKSQNYIVDYEVWRDGQTAAAARRFTAYTYAGMLSGWAFGANEHLAFSINALFPKPPPDQFLSIYAVCRDVLEATSLEDAVLRARIPGQAGGASFNLGEYSSKAVVNFETAPAAHKTRPARHVLINASAQPHQVAAHANSYIRLDVPDAIEHYSRYDAADSADRVRRAMALPPASSASMVLDIEGDIAGLFPIYNRGTLATALFDLTAMSWRVWNENAKGKAESPDITIPLPPHGGAGGAGVCMKPGSERDCTMPCAPCLPGTPGNCGCPRGCVAVNTCGCCRPK
eukprot:COSAG01_NODE_5979_length_3920_cov_6.749280_1_plen_456_part_00